MIEKPATTDHEILPEISNRWSPRAFSEKMVETEKLLKLLEAARWAPSSSNEQPWRFIIARKGDSYYDKLFEGLNESNQKWAWTAPVIGVTLGKKTFTGKDRENKYRLHDTGLAMGNLLAQATHEGLFVHQMAGIVPENIIRNFEIDENEYQLAAMFVIGYQDENRLSEMEERYSASERKQRERKSMKELVFGGKFGINPEWIK